MRDKTKCKITGAVFLVTLTCIESAALFAGYPAELKNAINFLLLALLAGGFNCAVWWFAIKYHICRSTTKG